MHVERNEKKVVHHLQRAVGAMGFHDLKTVLMRW